MLNPKGFPRYSVISNFPKAGTEVNFKNGVFASCTNRVNMNRVALARVDFETNFVRKLNKLIDCKLKLFWVILKNNEIIHVSKDMVFVSESLDDFENRVNGQVEHGPTEGATLLNTHFDLNGIRKTFRGEELGRIGVIHVGNKLSEVVASASSFECFKDGAVRHNAKCVFDVN